MSRTRTASSASNSSGGHESQYIGSILAEVEDEGERPEPTHKEVKDPIGFRSTSAPPQLAFLDSAQQPSSTEAIQPDDLRLTPEYYTYYYSQRPLDPRLPPPVFNWSTWHYANRAKLGAFTEKDFLFRAGLKVGDLATLSKSEKPEISQSPPSSSFLEVPGSSSTSTPSISPLLSSAPTGTDLEALAKKTQAYSASSSTTSSPRLFSQSEYEDGLTSLTHRFGGIGVGGGRPRTDSDRDRETFGTPSSSPPTSSGSLAQISSITSTMPRFDLGPSGSTGSGTTGSSSSSTTSSSTGSLGSTGFPSMPQPPQYPTAMTKMPFPTISEQQGPTGPSGPHHLYPPFRGMGTNPSPMMAVMGYGHLGPSRMGALEPTPISPSLSASLPDRRGPTESPQMVPLAGPHMDGMPVKTEGGYEEFRGPPPPYGGPGRGDGGFGRGRSPWGSEPQPFRGGRGGRGRGRGRGSVPFERKEGSRRSQPPTYGMGYPSSSGLSPSGTPPQTFRKAPPPTTTSMPLDPSQSAWLDDFRLNKTNSTLTLKDVVSRGLMLELATDQYGSRFIQQKLETATTEEKSAAFQQLLPEVLRLCTDVFGNYVIQKFFEHGIFEHKKILASKLIGNVLMLSLQMYGCRVVQKALDVSDADTQALLVRELNGHVMECVKDQNGNHVIQKCIEKVPPYLIGFIVEAFSHQIVNLSTHPYGCRVIQRLLEYCSETQRNAILTEILENVEDLCKNQYGNYVIQHVLIHGTPWHRGAIIRAVRGKILPLSKHKFASNVIEKCFAHASRQHRALLVEEVLGKEDRDPSKSPLISMVKDQYANYVIQKMVDVVDEDQRAMILHRIKRHVPNLRKIPYGKHIIARIEKLTGKPILP